ncbi:hypothetical protein TNCV_3378511 [Trichonephila clavipes]|nr:hypothetical protein TNCV_3378511 [Trichonephila clavipes]
MFEEPQWFSWHDGNCGNGSYISAFISHRSVRYTSYIEGMAVPKHSRSTLLHPIRGGRSSQFQKIECVGHVQKEWGTRLRKLKQMSSDSVMGVDWGGKGKVDRQSRICLFSPKFTFQESIIKYYRALKELTIFNHFQLFKGM